MCNNKGHSLVELIVVLGIMAIVLGITSMSASFMFSKDASRTAQIIDDELSEARLLALSSPGKYTMIIHCNKDGEATTVAGDGTYSGNYIELQKDLDGTTTVEKKISIDRKAIIMAGDDKDSITAPIADYDIEIRFSKANGSIVEFKVGGTALTGDMHYIKCQAVRNTSKTQIIDIMPITGRHSME